jgi:hypothetical protein
VSADKLVLNYSATNVAPTPKDQPLLLSKRRLHFKTNKWSWKEQKYVHASQPRMNVLAKASSKLLLKSVSQELAVSHELLSMEAEESPLLKAATK